MYKIIWLKEIKSQLYTWKSTLWLLVASLIFSFTSYLLLTDKELSLLDQSEMLWLLSKIIIGVALLIVTIDASGIINTEFEKETAESLFVSPLSLKDFILGKLLASLSLWLAIFLISVPYIIVTAIGTKLVIPFIFYAALLGTLGSLGIVLIVFGISLLFISSKNTLTTSLIMLLAFSIPALFSSTLTKNNELALAFSKINPIDNIFSSLDNVLVDFQTSLSQNFVYLFPLVLFCLISFIFMYFAINRFKKVGFINKS